jgi:hypothetical protein
MKESMNLARDQVHLVEAIEEEKTEIEMITKEETHADLLKKEAITAQNVIDVKITLKIHTTLI